MTEITNFFIKIVVSSYMTIIHLIEVKIYIIFEKAFQFASAFFAGAMYRPS